MGGKEMEGVGRGREMEGDAKERGKEGMNEEGLGILKFLTTRNKILDTPLHTSF